MATTQWVLDPTHSEVTFKVKHMMFTNVSGRFETFSATAETPTEDFDQAKIEFTADASSINTGNPDRDNHLRSGDFFDAEQFPKLTFSVASFKALSGEIVGELSLHGVTKTITLDVDFGGIGQDPWGNTKAGLTASGKINRKDFGLNWNATLEAGGVLVSEDVRLQIELQFVKQ